MSAPSSGESRDHDSMLFLEYNVDNEIFTEVQVTRGVESTGMLDKPSRENDFLTG